MVVIVGQFHCRRPKGKRTEKFSSGVVGRRSLTNEMDGDVSIKAMLKKEELVGLYETNITFPSASMLI